MPIPRQKYKELKAMYDFQRKQAYNKEKVRKAVEIMFEHPEVIFDDIWAKMKENEMHYVYYTYNLSGVSQDSVDKHTKA